MGKRPTDHSSRAEAEAEAWLEAAQREFTSGKKKSKQDDTTVQVAAAPEEVSDFVDEHALDAVQAAAASLACLRLALALKVGSAQWRAREEERLNEHLRALRTEDSEFHSELKVYYTAAGSGTPIASASASLLPALKLRGAMDALYWSLWGLACRRDVRIHHPVRIAERVATELLSRPPTARAVAQGTSLGTANRQAARRMGFKPSWLDAATKGSEKKKSGAAVLARSSPWRRGDCAMLRYLRCRWIEGCALVATDAGSAASPKLDAADAKLRAALLRWQFVGRDACARHLAFACPTSSALDAALRAAESASQRGGSSAGIVELGAGNGYWSKLLAKRARSFPCTVRALDVAPPPEWRQPAEAPVAFGTADDVASGRESTLLLCMPSPGEPAIAEEALDAFEAACGGGTDATMPPRRPSVVLYVGEWGSGMTGTRALHARLLEGYRLVATRTLPCLPLARITLHVFRRCSTGASGAAAPPPAAPRLPQNARCACCGSSRRLRACPWTRTVLLCSDACHAKAAVLHQAAIALTFCGVQASARPAFASFAPCEHLEATSASDQQWLRLAEATPQPERIIPV
jgi:hypothetical protein